MLKPWMNPTTIPRKLDVKTGKHSREKARLEVLRLPVNSKNQGVPTPGTSQRNHDMGLASALSTALTGLTASETTIDVVGNNLANSNTVGFKASSASFSTQFLQTLSLGSQPTEFERRYEPEAGRAGNDGFRHLAQFQPGHARDQFQRDRPGHPGRRVLHRGRWPGRNALHTQRDFRVQLAERDGHHYGQSPVGIRSRRQFPDPANDARADRDPAGSGGGGPADRRTSTSRAR